MFSPQSRLRHAVAEESRDGCLLFRREHAD